MDPARHEQRIADLYARLDVLLEEVMLDELREAVDRARRALDVDP